MANKVEDLRTHLFETLTALKREKNPMDVQRAHAIAKVATCIVETAKVEVAYLKEVGGRGSGFLPEPDDQKPNGRQLPAPHRHS